MESRINRRMLFKNLVSKVKMGTEEAFQSGISMLNDILNSNLENYKGLPENYMNILLKSIEERHNFKNYNINYSNTLVKSTLRLDAKLLPSSRWNHLMFLCINSGLFKVANIARTKAIQSAYQALGNTKNDETLIQSFKLYIDQGDLDNANNTLLSLKKSSLEKSFLNRMEIFYSILNGDKKRTNKLSKTHFSEQDQAFFNYVNGKSVAIVGPAPVEEDLSDEINSFDIVVRFNYTGDNHLPSKGFGNRTDVSYYNAFKAKKLSKLDNTDFFDELDFMCFKTIMYSFQNKLKSAHKGRVIRSPKQFLLNGSPNQLPNALFDILHFNPKFVKVFHNNLYLSNTPHYNGYHEQRKENRRLWFSFAVHEFVTQFNFLKNLWEMKQFTADKTLESVLNLTPEKYVELMEEIYVDPYLDK
ncbi:hypothetical protein [Aquibacillus albus]|uniref:Restriction endonuclease n=1 Tax=Aquibacillus albus TaxID=1168171 RepID=A0ABS2N4Y7_9BACI|nr:hypothetical protein [Aquibacillus albus]MBM7573186.1 hypothetical protein [Aquibacillus albus]